MRRFIAGLLLFISGWGLGWVTFYYLGGDSLQSAGPPLSVQAPPASPEEAATAAVPVRPAHGDDMELLLQRNEFGAVLERYESLQQQADEAASGHARAQILAYARQLIAERHFSLAELLLQGFLVSDYRDADARDLLAEVYQGRQEFLAAIDQLYEARGYAWRPAMLEHLTGRIRSVVAELTRSLQNNDDEEALLALYQHLTQLEPDHAPWFMGLAEAQLALGDMEAAQRSLLLVSQDPEVGVRAQAKLAELDLALAESQDAELQDAASDVVGIPLHRNGNHYFVDAVPANGRSIRLLIDTGATLTVLTPEVLEQHHIRYQDTGRTGIFNTANGQVRAPVYKLDYLSVGGWQVHHLEIGVLDLGGRAEVDGLLGMNFLSHFQFFIDQNEALLRLSAN